MQLTWQKMSLKSHILSHPNANEIHSKHRQHKEVEITGMAVGESETPSYALASA